MNKRKELIILEAAHTLMQDAMRVYSTVKNPNVSQSDLQGLVKHLEGAPANFEKLLKVISSEVETDADEDKKEGKDKEKEPDAG